MKSPQGPVAPAFTRQEERWLSVPLVAAGSSTQWPLVSIVLVNWNRVQDIVTTLRHLRRQQYLNIEIIVVDNGSNDGSVATLQAMDGIHLICLPQNYGPAKARNLGAQAASGRYLLFLDNDASLGKKALRPMVQRMEADPMCGIVGGRIMNAFTRKVDQWLYAQPQAQYSHRAFQTYSFSAAGALLRASTFHALKGFWEELFIYNEEVDLSLRFARAGYTIWYEPGAVILHRAAPTGRVAPGMYYYLQARNWVRIFYRYYPFPLRTWRICLYAAIYLLKGLRAGHPVYALRGIWDGIKASAVLGDVFTDRMTWAQTLRYEALNRRSRMRWTR